VGRRDEEEDAEGGQRTARGQDEADRRPVGGQRTARGQDKADRRPVGRSGSGGRVTRSRLSRIASSHHLPRYKGVKGRRVHVMLPSPTELGFG
jgi:hypothetical protein